MLGKGETIADKQLLLSQLSKKVISSKIQKPCLPSFLSGESFLPLSFSEFAVDNYGDEDDFAEEIRVPPQF